SAAARIRTSPRVTFGNSRCIIRFERFFINVAPIDEHDDTPFRSERSTAGYVVLRRSGICSQRRGGPKPNHFTAGTAHYAATTAFTHRSSETSARCHAAIY